MDRLKRRLLGTFIVIFGALLLLALALTNPLSPTAGTQETTEVLGATVGPGVWAQLPRVTMGAGTLTLSWVASGPIQLWVLNESQFAAFQVNATMHTSTQGGNVSVYWGPVPHLWSYTYGAVSSTGATASLPAGTFYLLASALSEVTVHSLSMTSPSYEGAGTGPGRTSYLFAGAWGALGVGFIALGAALWRRPKGEGKRVLFFTPVRHKPASSDLQSPRIPSTQAAASLPRPRPTLLVVPNIGR